jgi:HEAT repeat protein
MRQSLWTFSALLPLALAGSLSAQTQPPGQLTTGPSWPTEIAGKSLKDWMQDLKHTDPSVREKAIRMIPQFGPPARDAIPLLLDRCHDRDGVPRVRAVMALSVIEVKKEDVPKIVDELGRILAGDNQSIIRYHAAMGLVRFSSEAGRVLKELITGTHDQWAYDIRRASVVALRQAGMEKDKGPNPRATNALLEALKDSVADVRMEAVIGLGSMGKPSDPALLATVMRALNHTVDFERDKSVVIWGHVAIMALEEVTDKHLKPIIKLLKNPDLEVRCVAARAIGTMGTKAKSAIPDLIEMLHDKEPLAVVAACMALVQMGDPGERAISALNDLMQRNKDNEDMRLFIQAALDQIKSNNQAPKK